MKMSDNYQPHKFGKIAEDGVREHLQQQGLQLVERNYYCRLGEIDLIMRDKSCLVFVEVRARTNGSFADSLESVDFRKQQKIIKTATFYLQQQRLMDKINSRFDVVAVNGRADSLEFHWVKNAFGI
jgi:putative endonuclease